MAEDIPNITPVSPPAGESVSKLSAKFIPVVFSIIVVAAGMVTGYLLSGKKGIPGVSTGGKTNAISGKITKGSEFGAQDSSVFKDTAIGVLETGGTDGEGTHHLVREGGPSQTVYLTSSVLDLEQFVGRKMQVWGETLKAQKAGWLMDVGKVKALE